MPELSKIVEISKYFDISLDALILGNDNRLVEELKFNKVMKPQYSNLHQREFYAANLITEYTQSIEEGLDIEKYKDLFEVVSKLPQDETKRSLSTLYFKESFSKLQFIGYFLGIAPVVLLTFSFDTFNHINHFC